MGGAGALHLALKQSLALLQRCNRGFGDLEVSQLVGAGVELSQDLAGLDAITLLHQQGFNPRR